MENSELAFSLEGVDYRADPHIWDDHPNRIGLVTIERIRDTIRAPDLTEEVTNLITIFWRWFRELGKRGNYVKVIVKFDGEVRLVTTSHPDSNLRSRMGPP